MGNPYGYWEHVFGSSEKHWQGTMEIEQKGGPAILEGYGW